MAQNERLPLLLPLRYPCGRGRGVYYSDLDQRVRSYPEMMGTDIDFNEFLNKYFLNTAFLINLERYNEMGQQDKLQLGLDDNCLFGVINRLTPTEEEINLAILKKYPY